MSWVTLVLDFGGGPVPGTTQLCFYFFLYLTLCGFGASAIH